MYRKYYLEKLFPLQDKILSLIQRLNVPFYLGVGTIFNKVDNWRNILSNKLCALSRRDVKDLVDILFISKKYDFSWEDIFREAKEKDLWADPIEVCKIISEFPKELLSTINWVSAVDIDEIYLEIHTLHDDIFWGRENTLAKS